MLKDIFFYPLAALIIGAMIFGALSFGDYEVLTPENIRANGFTVEGPDLATLTAAPGTNYEYIAETVNTPSHARLVTTLARDVAPSSQGIFAVLNSDYESAFENRHLRLTITARSSVHNGLADFDMSYFTTNAGATGWQRKTLTQDWSDYVLDFKFGALKGESDLSYFSIWPGITGEPLTMDVSKMHIEIIGAP